MAAVPSIGRAKSIEEPLRGLATHAAEGLYERHYRRILGFCQYQLGTRQEAEDAAQTTFLHALGALRRGVVPVREVPWLLTIARNVCRTRWDVGRRRGRIEFCGDPQLIAETAVAADVSEWTLLGLEEALAELPQQQRLAILLREWQGLSYHEIADVLGVSVSAVETSIFRARRALARRLGDEEGRRHGFDLGSLLAACKSALFGGGSATLKIAAAAAVVAAGTGTGVAVVELRDAPAAAATTAAPESTGAVPLPASLGSVRVVAPSRPRQARLHSVPAAAKPRATTSKPAAAAPKKPLVPPTAVPPAPPTAPSAAIAPATASSSTASQSATTKPAPAATRPVARHGKPVTQPVVDTVTKTTKPVVDTVTNVTKPVVDTVTNVAKPVVDTVTDVTQPVTNTVANTTQPVVNTVTNVAGTVVPPPPAPPAAPAPPPATPPVTNVLPPLPVTPPRLPLP